MEMTMEESSDTDSMATSDDQYSSQMSGNHIKNNKIDNGDVSFYQDIFTFNDSNTVKKFKAKPDVVMKGQNFELARFRMRHTRKYSLDDFDLPQVVFSKFNKF